VHLTVANAGVVKFQMDIDPTGALTVSAQSVAVTTQGNASITANGNMTLSTPNRTVNINGVSIDHSGNATTAGEVTAKGIPLSTHKTLGVTSGTSESELPSAT
jgi:phage baseplate assembly protein gpV